MRPKPQMEDIHRALLPALPPPSLRGRSGDAIAPFFAGDLRAILIGALRIADIAVVAAAASFSYWLRHGTFDLPANSWWDVTAVCLIAANILHSARIYNFAGLRQRARHLGRLAVSWMTSVLAVITLIFFTKMGDEFSRIWMALWASCGLAGLVLVRVACWLWIARLGRQGKLAFNIAIVGPFAAAKQLALRVGDGTRRDICILGVFRSTAEGADAGAPDLEALAALARRIRIDEVVLAVPAHAPGLDAALRALATIPTDVKLCLEVAAPQSWRVTPVVIPPLLLSRRPLAGWGIVVKRAMDVAISAALIVVLAPLMLLIALCIIIDSRGPAIFRQQRLGFSKQPITIYKFRTMDRAASVDPSVPQARPNDPRVTRLGRFLRRTSLDELPQLLNVLVGDMSLVGPRPHAIVHDEKYAALIDGYLARHRVLPGITGWAQVNGLRGETDTLEKMKRRLEHDLFYIDNWSPLFDLRILILTLCVGFLDRNAY